MEIHDIIVYGAGGFGREVALMIRQINQVTPTWNLIGFCDDGKNTSETVDGLPVIGGVRELNHYPQPVAVALAIADPHIRRTIRQKIDNGRITFPAIIHPSVLTGDHERVTIGEGTIICAGTVLTTNVRIKPFVIINLLCSIGHDVVINEFSSIMPCCSLSGFDTIGSEVLIGTGARILPQLTIGDGSKVGAGAVVVEPVPAGLTVVGIPAKAL